MNTLDIFKQQIQQIMDTDYSSFVKALISIETGETNINELQALYDSYMENDDVTLLSDFFYKQYQNTFKALCQVLGTATNPFSFFHIRTV